MIVVAVDARDHVGIIELRISRDKVLREPVESEYGAIDACWNGGQCGIAGAGVVQPVQYRRHGGVISVGEVASRIAVDTGGRAGRRPQVHAGGLLDAMNTEPTGPNPAPPMLIPRNMFSKT